jgi:hypothetical protein
MLRFMTWLCLKDNALSGSQMCIVTGPRIDLAIALIDRLKGLFRGKGLLVFDTKETVIEPNGVKIEAFPSHHLDAMLYNKEHKAMLGHCKMILENDGGRIAIIYRTEKKI